ncbi:MAG: lytic transglycosylase domain-containing protein, partial [Giesbergeria sp.]
MHWMKILTPLALALSLTGFGGSAHALAVGAAPTVGDQVLLDMQQAFRKKDRTRLAQLLPQASGHALEPWAAYWELRARLEDAQADEVEAFFLRWAGTYQEDRLRNDWLRLLGQRREWARFAAAQPQFRMGDDREVRCYALSIAQIEGRAPQDAAAQVRDNWFALRDADDGCTHAAGEFFAARVLPAADVWRKARLAIEANRVRAAREAVAIVATDLLPQVGQLNDAPTKFLRARATAPGHERKEIMVLALIKLATSDPDNAAQMLDSKWSVHFNAEERNWTWGVIGKQAALRLSPDAAGYFAKVSRDADLSDDLLAWKVRAALRAGQWDAVRKAVAAMSPEAQKDSAWIYWRARALLQGRVTDAERAEASALLRAIAGPSGFYEQLALEDLGER